MGKDGFKIAPDDLSASTYNGDWESNTIREHEEVFLRRTESEEVLGIHVYLLPEVGQIQKLWLPISAEGKYLFDWVDNVRIRENLYFLAEEGEWYACCSKPTYFIGRDGMPYYSTKLTDGCLIEVGNLGQTCKLYVEKSTKESLKYYNYQLYLGQEVTIGRLKGSDICYQNPLVSREHAKIYWKANELWIKDTKSANGIWINGKKIDETRLSLGDTINILGLNIIVGTSFISVNSGKQDVSIEQIKLRQIIPEKSVGLMHMTSNSYDKNKLYNRLPRRIKAFEPKTIKVEGPPMSLSANNVPLMLRMGSSMVMGGTAAMAGNYTMLLSSVLFPVLNQKYSDKEKKEYEKSRLEKYREYLEVKRKELIDEKEYEENILKSNYPELDVVLSYPMEGLKLWERRKTDEDFLKLRIGYGEAPLSAGIEYPNQRFSIDEDILEKEMYELVENPVKLEDVPILIDFIENNVSSISGRKQLSISLVKRIVMMSAILNSYDEVKMVFLAEQNQIDEELSFVKYIPHVWDDQKNIRFIATTPSEAYQIGEVIKQEIEEELKKPKKLNEILKQRPYYLVFALNKRLFDSMEILKDVVQQEKTCGVSVVTVFDEVPKECSILFDMHSSGENKIIYLREISRADDVFKLDRFNKVISEKSMKLVANTYLKSITQSYSLPKMLTFLEMYKVGKTEHLNVVQRWNDNNPVKSLAVPVGVGTDGSPFYLDLHQKYQGPHGLVAGTTGSGKSEFLLTYILSMAVNFHPDEVAFVLIDYKGGGLAGAFDDPGKGIRLPHLVGTITNLDGASIQRSLVSIQSELTRRQKLFNEVKKTTDEGTMDIYTYQKLYRNKKVSEPMPHLFIISDEFAELKQQQPDFMDQLISAARIGRSLGIHLILATQKPAGVVNDQIRSNTKFRVCLKVQDKADSQDMLKRSEAAELKDTGRFYLQVGYNEYFALGQSAWSGADYEPQDEVVVKKDDSVQVLDSIGQTMLEVKPTVKRVASEGPQLVAVVKMLSEVAKNLNIKTRNLWEPELKRHIDVEELEKKTQFNSQITCPLGMLDDPEMQKQYVLNYNFEQSQHLLIVGDASSGKTLMLQSMLYSLTKRYKPEELNYYILDYSSRLLKRFSKLPHCGGVLLEEDEESVDSFFEIINGIVDERKKLFLKIGADSFTTAKEIVNIPLILVVIDNISALGNSKKTEQYVYKLQAFLKDALNYGVKYVVTSSYINETSVRLRQELGDRICLHMKDKYEYGDGLKCKVNYTPAELPGRGLYCVEGRPLEFHASIFHATSSDKQRVKELEREVENLLKKYAGSKKAKRLPVIVEDATYEEFSEQFSEGRIPLGYSKKTQKPVALPLKQFCMLSVYQGNKNGVLPILDNFLHAVQREKMPVWFLKKKKESKLDECVNYSNYSDVNDFRILSMEQNVMEQLWHELAEEISRRLEIQKSYCAEKGIVEDKKKMAEKAWEHVYSKTRPLVLMIENYAEFCMTLDQVSVLVFDKLFHALNGLNIYIIAFFDSEDSDEIKKNYLYSGFNIDGPVMLLGGMLDKQSLVELPREAIQSGKILPFNICIMRYRGAYHPMLVPCGEVNKEVVDSDSQDIFI